MKIPAGLQPFVIEHLDIILVVEDNLDDQLILHYLLRKQIPGILPVGATSVEQAFTYLTNCHTQHFALPSLILLDLYLPDPGDGWKLLRQLRNHPVYQNIPVVIVSSSTDLNDIEQSYQCGACSYLIKPITLEGWEQMLQSIPPLFRK
ncbi:response regulator [Larkinella terrae]|uniref:Response regulator n=1 Tax=Larkinella terrae TaxID=2025311 RepID=A0A7K0EET2_9BACT|nr:response regulator [Larkinella terrae]MRS60349.1 response regulator [Larkinella terrae]